MQNFNKMALETSSWRKPSSISAITEATELFFLDFFTLPVKFFQVFPWRWRCGLHKGACLVGHKLSFNCLEYFGAIEKRNVSLLIFVFLTSKKCKQTATPPSWKYLKEFDRRGEKIKEKKVRVYILICNSVEFFTN